MSEKPVPLIRWRWAIGAGADLSTWSAMRHTVRHEIVGYLWPSILTLPILWLSALSITFLAIVGWGAKFHPQR